MGDLDFSQRKRDTDKNCEINGSELCSWLAANSGCAACHIHEFKTDHQKKEALDRWRQTLALIPDNIDTLHTAESCQFCKDKKNKADGYALLEMANAEPYYEKGMILGYGKKIRAEVGSLLAIQSSICAACRKKLRYAEIIPIITVTVFAAIAVIITTVPAIGVKFNGLIGVLFFGCITAAGYFAGLWFKKFYVKKIRGTVKTDISEVPQFKNMLNAGWFLFQPDEDMPKFSFSKHKKYDCIKGCKLDSNGG